MFIEWRSKRTAYDGTGGNQKIEGYYIRILEKDYISAKALIKDVIQNDARYIAYKKQLKEYGFFFEKVDVPEKIYEDLENVLKDFHPEAKLKIIDNLYLKISNNNL